MGKHVLIISGGIAELAAGCYARMNGFKATVVELLFEHPYCNNEFIIKNIGVKRKAASRYLHKLEEIVILERYKIGKENIYINKELMKVLTV